MIFTAQLHFSPESVFAKAKVRVRNRVTFKIRVRVSVKVRVSTDAVICCRCGRCSGMMVKNNIADVRMQQRVKDVC